MHLPVSAESPLLPVWSPSRGLAIRDTVLIDSGTAALTSSVASAGFKFLGPGWPFVCRADTPGKLEPGGVATFPKVGGGSNEKLIIISSGGIIIKRQENNSGVQVKKPYMCLQNQIRKFFCLFWHSF